MKSINSDYEVTKGGSGIIWIMISSAVMSGVLTVMCVTHPISPSNTIPFLITAICCFATAISAIVFAIRNYSSRKFFIAAASVFVLCAILWFYVVFLSLH